MMKSCCGYECQLSARMARAGNKLETRGADAGDPDGMGMGGTVRLLMVIMVVAKNGYVPHY